MNVNKKTVVILGGTVGLILGASGCASSTYEYQVSGDVVSQQIDYKCPKKTLSMEAVAFVTGKHKSTGSGSKKKSDSGSGKKDDSSGTVAKKDSSGSSPKSTKTPSATPSKKGTDTGTGTSRSTTRTASATPSPKPLRNKGVTFSSKPDKPEKLRSVPKVITWHKGCKVDDYEIFVVDKKGNLYEQDVRRTDYNNCARAGIPKGKKYKLFPLCTKG